MNISQVMVTSPHGVWVEGVDYGLRNETFMSEMLTFKNIENVGFSSIVPGYESGEVSGGYYVEGQIESNSQQLYNYSVSQNFLKFYKIALICGENFSSYDKSDHIPSHNANTELIINLTACKKLGFSNPKEALGKRMVHDKIPCGTIIGVVKDFHQESLDKRIQPSYLRCHERINYITIKISNLNIPATISYIKKKYNELYPGNPFDYYFLDEQFNQQYKDKIQTANFIGLFSILAIFLNCLGLLGLIIFDSKAKTKEIGIRKVNGANVSQIIVLFLTEKVRLIIISMIVALPISYVIMQKWLQNFAYKISLGWWFFILPVIIILVISILTITLYVIKIARANPSEALKYE